MTIMTGNRRGGQRQQGRNELGGWHRFTITGVAMSLGGAGLE